MATGLKKDPQRIILGILFVSLFYIGAQDKLSPAGHSKFL